MPKRKKKAKKEKKINRCDISIILDRSGSMSSVQDATIKSFNDFVAEQKKSTAGECTLSLYQFDDQYETVFAGLPLDQAPPLTSQTFQPRGSTALLDAIGRTIEETDRRLHALPEAEKPSSLVIIVILTDGYENASRVYSRDRVFGLISGYRDIHKWEFVFLGADQDAIASATALGINPGSAMSYIGNAVGTSASVTATSGAIMRARSMGTVSRRGLYST